VSKGIFRTASELASMIEIVELSVLATISRPFLSSDFINTGPMPLLFRPRCLRRSIVMTLAFNENELNTITKMNEKSRFFIFLQTIGYSTKNIIFNLVFYLIKTKINLKNRQNGAFSFKSG